MTEQGGWYFTAPWDPVTVRRGDALGLRAGADYFAELLAPGLSNSTSDARWISILSWCLKWSHVTWRNAGGIDLSRREGQRERYAWLRPLELLWVARTLVAGQTTGQLRGRRSVARWITATEDGQLSPNFEMSADQFRRYRQVGMYGAYRVVFRSVPGLTTGDGWTLANTAHQLANLVNETLPQTAQLKQQRFENGTKWSHWIGKEARYWLEIGWQAEWKTIGGFLPTPDHAVRALLPKKECDLLAPSLFAADSIRRMTAEVLAGAKTAKMHAELCEALANSSMLAKKIAPVSLASLPAFTRFADAAMLAMRALWREVNHDDNRQAPSVRKLASSADLQARFSQLRDAGNAWLKTPSRSSFPHEQVATQLAEAMRGAKTPSEQLRALARHHHEHGGGRRWFREQADTIIPLVADTGIAASDYRFRLRSLCLLAAQCGIANMNNAIDALEQQETDDEESNTP